MSKKKMLVPIDGSERSLISLDFIKNNFKPDEVEIVLMHVREVVFINGMAVAEEVKNAEILGLKVLHEARKQIKGFDVIEEFTFGSPGDEIIDFAEKNDVDIIVMAKNTNKKFSFFIGSVTEYVVKRVKCIVIMVPEEFKL